MSEAHCPDCGKAATRVLPTGDRLFRCAPCKREWGHPQDMCRVTATMALCDAKSSEGETR
jgi:tRNA(Ile2) C34 agmatinyltransferase TiaS